jgi:pyruvate/2-oxoglutarate dehydrogenase complex dihydrolipoamide dehydrogenase (E3) component
MDTIDRQNFDAIIIGSGIGGLTVADLIRQFPHEAAGIRHYVVTGIQSAVDRRSRPR